MNADERRRDLMRDNKNSGKNDAHDNQAEKKDRHDTDGRPGSPSRGFFEFLGRVVETGPVRPGDRLPIVGLAVVAAFAAVVLLRSGGSPMLQAVVLIASLFIAFLEVRNPKRSLMTIVIFLIFGVTAALVLAPSPETRAPVPLSPATSNEVRERTPVHGVVRYKNHVHPIPGVRVWVDGDLGRYAVTNARGAFDLEVTRFDAERRDTRFRVQLPDGRVALVDGEIHDHDVALEVDLPAVSHIGGDVTGAAFPLQQLMERFQPEPSRPQVRIVLDSIRSVGVGGDDAGEWRFQVRSADNVLPIASAQYPASGVMLVRAEIVASAPENDTLLVHTTGAPPSLFSKPQVFGVGRILPDSLTPGQPYSMEMEVGAPAKDAKPRFAFHFTVIRLPDVPAPPATPPPPVAGNAAPRNDPKFRTAPRPAQPGSRLH